MKFLVQPRRWWLAAPPRGQLPVLQHPAEYVIFSFTTGKYLYNNKLLNNEIRRMQYRHMTKGSEDIHYNFLIGANGQVLEGRGWNACPSLGSGLYPPRDMSISIAYMGVFKDSFPPKKMVMSGDWLVKLGVVKGFIKPKFLEIRKSHCGLGWERDVDRRESWARNTPRDTM